MPRFPEGAPSLHSIKGSVFSALAGRLAAMEGPTYPLHIGDTWMEPAVGCRMQDLTVEDHPGMHRYASPQGMHALRDTIAARVTAKTGLHTEAEDVLVSAGATGALGAVLGSILAPGDEVLVVAPFWPLIAGIVRSFHGKPVAVPLMNGEASSAEEAVAALELACTSRTCAVYWNTPNNPTGRTLPRDWLEAMVSWAKERGLWIISDEVYEDYVYGGAHHYTRPLAPERVFSAYSFSKGFGMAGNRCGYVVGPRGAIAQAQKVSTHTFYSTPTASQLAALEALGPAGLAWVEQARDAYRALGDYASERLGVPAPEGSTFLFLDVADQLDDRGLMGFLEDCVDRGLFLAPGASFGPYPTHVRVCFTCIEPDRVRAGIDVLAELLGR